MNFTRKINKRKATTANKLLGSPFYFRNRFASSPKAVSNSYISLTLKNYYFPAAAEFFTAYRFSLHIQDFHPVLRLPLPG